MLRCQGEVSAAAVTEHFRTVYVQANVKSAFEMRAVSGSMCTAKHEGALGAHVLAATANASAPAVGHLANPGGGCDRFDPRGRADTRGASDPGMQTLVLRLFGWGCHGRRAALDNHDGWVHGAAVSKTIVVLLPNLNDEMQQNVQAFRFDCFDMVPIRAHVGGGQSNRAVLRINATMHRPQGKRR